MQIDPHAEQHVREAFAAVIARDGDRLVAAFRGLDTDASATAVAYGIFVVGYIVNDVFRDGRTDQQLRELAGKIVAGESNWIDLGSPDDVARLLGAAARGDLSFPGVPPEEVLGTIFVCGGHLLGVYRREDQRWWGYLDEIWEELLAAPDRA